MGWQTCGQKREKPTTAARFGRFRRLREASTSAARNDHATMATSMSNDPLGAQAGVLSGAIDETVEGLKFVRDQRKHAADDQSECEKFTNKVFSSP